MECPGCGYAMDATMAACPRCGRGRIAAAPPPMPQQIPSSQFNQPPPQYVPQQQQYMPQPGYTIVPPTPAPGIPVAGAPPQYYPGAPTGYAPFGATLEDQVQQKYASRYGGEASTSGFLYLAGFFGSLLFIWLSFPIAAAISKSGSDLPIMGSIIPNEKGGEAVLLVFLMLLLVGGVTFAGVFFTTMFMRSQFARYSDGSGDLMLAGYIMRPLIFLHLKLGGAVIVLSLFSKAMEQTRPSEGGAFFLGMVIMTFFSAAFFSAASAMALNAQWAFSRLFQAPERNVRLGVNLAVHYTLTIATVMFFLVAWIMTKVAESSSPSPF